MTNKLQIILILMLFSFGINNLNAASFELSHVDKEVKFKISDDEAMRKSNVDLKTSSVNPISVVVKITPQKMSKAGSEYSICTPASCYPSKSTAWEAPAFRISSTTSELDRHYYISLVVDEEKLSSSNDTSIIDVTVYNAADPTDAVSYTITYVILNGSSVVSYWKNTSSVSPNPATDFINIRVNDAVANSVIRIFNEMGSEVSSAQFNSSEYSVNTSAFANGRYYFSVENAGKVINSGNFVVAR